MHVGVAGGWRWLRWGSAQHSRYDGTPARLVAAGDQIEWAAFLFVATSPPINRPATGIPHGPFGCLLGSRPPLSRPEAEQGTGARPDTELEAEVTGSLPYASHDPSVHASQMMPRAECRPVDQVIRAASRPEHDVVVVQVRERRAARHRAAPPVTLEHPMRWRQPPTVPTPDIDYVVEHRLEPLALGG